jgi:hypothetical protein
LPSVPCAFCGAWGSDKTACNASVFFKDKSTVRDIPAAVIERLAKKSEDRHALRAPDSSGRSDDRALHPRCKQVLLEVKNAFASEPKPPTTRNNAAGSSSSYQPDLPAQRAPYTSEVDSLAEASGQALQLDRRGEVMLVDTEALGALARAEAAAAAVVRPTSAGGEPSTDAGEATSSASISASGTLEREGARADPLEPTARVTRA